MDATQSTSKEPSTPKALAQNKPNESASVDAPTSLQNQSEIKSDVCYAIPGELLRALVDQKRKPSRIGVILSHPLTIVVISGGLIGGWLANYYTNRQKDFEYQRTIQLQKLTRDQSFSDEINRLRVQKLGEVWERLDTDEFAIDKIIEEVSFETEKQPADLNKKRFSDITKLLHDDQAFVSRYRYWLGEDVFKATNDYLNLNIRLARNQLVLAPQTDLRELIQKRKEAKQDILKIRRLLDGEPNTQSTTAPTK